MHSFGPSDQQIAADEAAVVHERFMDERVLGMSREELIASLEAEILKNSKLAAEVRELKEEKIKLSLILEEEDERRSNMFLKKMEELEESECCKCQQPRNNISITTSRSNSITSIKQHPMGSLPETD